MISTLIKRELKANYKILLIFMAILSMYCSVIVMMYDPTLGESLYMMAKSMPQLFAAFGMMHPGITLLDFIINYLYGFIMIVIPFLYILIMCYRLIARYIDRGTLVYLLTTSYSRKKVILTQYLNLLLGTLFLIVYSCSLIILCSYIMFDEKIDISSFIMLNTGLICLHLFFMSMCFFTATTFNEIKYSLGIGGGLGMIFILIQMLSQVSDKLEFLKYFTPLTLFDASSLVKFESITGIVVLFMVSIFILVLSIDIFSKRDLPL